MEPPPKRRKSYTAEFKLCAIRYAETFNEETGEENEEVWLQRANPGTSEETALILDSAKCHLIDKAKATVNATVKIAVIPGGLTKKLMSVNKSFKNKQQTQWKQWMIDTNSHTYTRSGKMRNATYLEVCNWVIKNWEEVTPTCIMNGFRKSLNADADKDEEEEDSEMNCRILNLCQETF
uniref:DDE-1 domain-containing protein n=1 Tax=Acrobeloides nanus TaxID=290746 RepID=A0A914EJ52_9BILA